MVFLLEEDLFAGIAFGKPTATKGKAGRRFLFLLNRLFSLFIRSNSKK